MFVVRLFSFLLHVYLSLFQIFCLFASMYVFVFVCFVFVCLFYLFVCFFLSFFLSPPPLTLLTPSSFIHSFHPFMYKQWKLDSHGQDAEVKYADEPMRSGTGRWGLAPDWIVPLICCQTEQAAILSLLRWELILFALGIHAHIMEQHLSPVSGELPNSSILQRSLIPDLKTAHSAWTVFFYFFILTYYHYFTHPPNCSLWEKNIIQHKL